MIPAFVIHHDSCVERKSLVDDLIAKTGATISPAILFDNRVAGCRMSHQKVAHQVQQMMRHNLLPDTHYLVFEDDCVLEDNWKDGLDLTYDVVYLGYNDKCEHTVFGTHALLISPRARDVIIQHSESLVSQVGNPGAYDWILSKLCRDYNLTVKLPERWNQYCHQKEGLKSQITGKMR